MKRICIISTALFMALSLNAQVASQGYVSYSLTKTSISFDVTARREVFRAGPYAKYAAKFMGAQARTQDEVSYEITSVQVASRTEADQSARFQAPVDDRNLLRLTTQGLVAAPKIGGTPRETWRFPVSKDFSFEAKGMPSNLTQASNTLQGRNQAFQQEVIVVKSEEKKASEIAEKIFKIRDYRYKILVGDTDANYAGEAMKAAVDELAKMEEDYMSLFFGHTEYSEQHSSFEVIPERREGRQLYVAFRLSETEGLVASDNMSGRPFYLELFPEPVAVPEEPAKGQKVEYELNYRIPAICTAVLLDGTKQVFSSRIPVCQLGIDAVYPVIKKK